MKVKTRSKQKAIITIVTIALVLISHQSFAIRHIDKMLMDAVKGGYTARVVELIDRGADVNKKDNFGYTPLIQAAWRGHTDIATLLIEGGADVNTKDNFGYTALIQATVKGHTDIIKLLRAHGATE
jgi:ankyrin repeat protein